MKNFTLFAVLLFSNFLFSQYTYVPDDNFEQALIDQGFDSGLDNWVITANIENVTTLWVWYKNVSDLTGIEDFTNLELLYAHGNNLSSVDLSQNIALRELLLNGSNLTSIDLSQNPDLRVLHLNNNNFSDLNITQNPNLYELEVFNNNISEFDFSNNPNITKLVCGGTNPITTIDLSQLVNLTEINVNYINTLSLLDVSQNPLLTTLDCYDSNLSCLIVSNGSNTSITDFDSRSNPSLTCIEVDDAAWSSSNWTMVDPASSFNSQCYCDDTYVPDDNFEQRLIDLGYDSGTLDDYVLTKNINTVVTINLNGYNISDITGLQDFKQLTNLYCGGNLFTSLDVSVFPNLFDLGIVGSQLTSLDLSQNPNLGTLECYNNQELTSLNLKNGNNTNIYWLDASNTPNLECIEVDDAAYSAANWTFIDPASSFSEDCAATLSLDEINLKDQIKIFPNPFANEIRVELSSTTQFLDNTIYNLQGQMILKSKQKAINTDKLASGVYFLKVETDKGIIAKKIIKQ